MNIFGARGQIGKIEDILQTIFKLEKQHDSTVQLFRADRIFGKEHLQTATEMATRAWASNPRTKTLGMEILLYAAAERQISGAIKKLGVQDDTTETAIITVGQISPEEVLAALNLQRADDVLNAQDKDHSIFQISQEEMNFASPAEIILERMALSELNK